MAIGQNITRPAMIEVLLLNTNTRGLAHMNMKQMLEIIKQKGCLEQARKLSKERMQRKGKELKLVDITTGEDTIFHSINEASKRQGKEVCF